MSTQVIAVIGSTGAQGFSVIQSLLETPHPIRAFTRSPSKLQHLVHPNLIVLQADPSDSAALKASLNGVWALFLNTFSDYTQPPGTEEKQGNAIVDAAAEAGVEWLVLSSLPVNMPSRAFKEKSNVMKHAREIAKRSNLKNVFVHLGYYMSNFNLLKPVLNSTDGVIEFRWSTIDEKTYFPLIATQTDLGPIVKVIIENPLNWNDAEIPIVGDALTVPQIAEIYGKVYNRPTRAVFQDHIPRETSFGGWIEMHKYFKDVGYFPAYVGKEDELPNQAKKLHPGLKTWEQWLREVGLDFEKEN